MNFRFEKLIIWQTAMEFGEQIHVLARLIPKEESYNLGSQIRRAADYIALNIAEGSINQSNAEMKKYSAYSIRSLAEVITCLYKAKNRGYINAAIFQEHYEAAYKLMRMLLSFRNKISYLVKKSGDENKVESE
jgi:four helix bundle protein